MQCKQWRISARNSPWFCSFALLSRFARWVWKLGDERILANFFSGLLKPDIGWLRRAAGGVVDICTAVMSRGVGCWAAMAELAKNLVKSLTRCFATTGKTTLFSSDLKSFKWRQRTTQVGPRIGRRKTTPHVEQDWVFGRRSVNHARTKLCMLMAYCKSDKMAGAHSNTGTDVTQVVLHRQREVVDFCEY